VRAAALPLLCAWLSLACGGLPLYETPEQRSGGRPVTQALHRRTGELTWRPGLLENTPEGVLLEFTLVNGTSRDYLSIMLRLVLRGGDQALATVRYPAGPLAAGASRGVRAHLPPPGFVAESADVELIWAQE
jgi:hypothetical protein